MRGFGRFLRRNTIALLALFVALSGTAFAAATVVLPANSVGAKQLKKNAVTPAKIRKSAVTNPKLAKNAVTGAKVKDNSLTGADVLESSLGKVPSATSADTATTVGGSTVKSFVASVASGGAAATVLNLNGLIITLTCAAGNVDFVANNNSGENAQLRFEGHGNTNGSFDNGASNLAATSNFSLNNAENVGSGSAHYVRANGTGVSASYGWRNDALGTGGPVACRVFGFAVSG
jgi:hypothetical protein